MLKRATRSGESWNMNQKKKYKAQNTKLLNTEKRESRSKNSVSTQPRQTKLILNPIENHETPASLSTMTALCLLSLRIGCWTPVNGKPRQRAAHTPTKVVRARVVNCVVVVIGCVVIGSVVVAVGSVATICVIITKLYGTGEVRS